MVKQTNPTPFFGDLDSVETVTINPQRNRQLRAEAGFTLREIAKGIASLPTIDLTEGSIRVHISKAENQDGRMRRDLFNSMVEVIDSDWRERKSTSAEVDRRRAVMCLIDGQLQSVRAEIRRQEIEQNRNLFKNVAARLREAEQFAKALRAKGSPGFERAEHQVAQFVDLAERTRRISERFDDNIFDEEIQHGAMLVEQAWSRADDYLARLGVYDVEQQSKNADLVKGDRVGRQ
jgi:hypothetical protein